jgi:putative intracellular protease/amidase
MDTGKQSQAVKKILLIAANGAVSPQTGWPVGFWWAELTHPYAAFREAGYEVDIRSPGGGALQADGYSDPEDPSGYSAEDFISLGFKKSPGLAALLENTRSIAGLGAGDHDAIFVIGGQSPMITFRGDAALARLVASFHEAGKPTALVCHGTCILLETRLSNGRLLIEGKTWTGFATSEEKAADAAVGRRIQPFWIEEEAKKIAGTRFLAGPAFSRFAVRDGHLVTGQQQHSGRAAAELVIELLEATAEPGVTVRGKPA